MGRESTITYEQVAEAAASLQAAGSKPTSRSIRERLGNVGSMGTVNKLLQAWRGRQEGPTADARALPGAVQRSLLEFVAQEVGNAKAGLEVDLADLQQEMVDLAADNERHTADVAEKQALITALQAELATSQGRLTQMESELAASRAEMVRAREAAESHRIELAKTTLRLEMVPKLEAEVAGLKAELERERQGRVAAERQAAVLETKLEAAAGETAIGKLNGRIEALQAQIGAQAGLKSQQPATTGAVPRARSKR